MAALKVTVSSEGKRWKIRHNFYAKYYPTKDDALQAAIQMAHAASELGNTVEVLLADDQGEPIAIWVSGRDCYPTLPATPDQ
jgi:hypothetical protein